MEEFCKDCTFCCHIYKASLPDEIIKEKLLGKDLSVYGVEPLKRVGDRCEFLGENGCIIERSKRPLNCLAAKCKALKLYEEGIKNVRPPYKKENI